MTNYTIRKVSSVQGLYDTHEETIYDDLGTNPGSVVSDIVTRTGLSNELVSSIIRIMQEQGIVRVGLSIDGGTVYHWRAIDWISLIVTNRAASRTWLETHDGGSVSDMAADLSVPEPVAEALARFLQQEYSAALTLQ